MDLVKQFVLFVIFAEFPVGVKSALGCFQNDCDLLQDGVSCLLDEHNAWNCNSQEYCEITSNHRTLNLQCRDTNQMQDPCSPMVNDGTPMVNDGTPMVNDGTPMVNDGTPMVNDGTPKKCHQVHNHNSAWCSTAISSGHYEHSCIFCCSDRQCIIDLSSLPSVTSPIMATGTDGAKIRVARALQTEHPGHNSCYTSPCNRGDDITLCASGIYACRENEFCDLHVHNNGDINMKCRPNMDHEIQDCESHQFKNSAFCTVYTLGHDCRYCCYSPACVQRIATPTATSSLSTRMSASSVTTATEETPKAGSSNCFTSDCYLHSDLASCFSGQWACHSNQFCKLEVHKNGEHLMECLDIGKELPTCQHEESKHNDHTCRPLLAKPHVDCRFCCLDDACMRIIADPSATSIFSSTVNTASIHSSTANTASIRISTADTASIHSSIANTASILSSTDNTASIRISTANTASILSSTTNTASIHSSTANTASIHSSTANTASIRISTANTASILSSTANTARFPSPTANTANILRSTVNTTVASAIPTKQTTSIGSMTSPQSTTMKLASESEPANVGITTTTTVDSTPTLPTAIQCVQCGDYDKGIPCSDLQLIFEEVTVCKDATTRFCMTDVLVDADARASTFKRCVNTETCLNEWYLGTSDKPVCLEFDPLIATPELVCHFCCIGNGCNTNTVPEDRLLWRP